MQELINTDNMFYTGAGLLVLGISTCVFLAMSAETTEVAGRGLRGYQRQRARQSPGFASFEPLLRLFASWISLFPLDDLRESLDKELAKAGQYLGLTADEHIALSVLSGIGGAMAMLVMFNKPMIIVVGTGMSAMVPFAMVSGAASRRAILVSRELASVIELIALCVSAGMDLPGALREVTGDDPEKDDPLRQELRQLLREIDLGHSRRQALESLAERVDGDGVRDFCASVIQSEERGNPLKDVLAAQAKVLRMRRSFRAEVMASQAAVKLVIPLTMLMFVVLLLVGAPLFIKLKEGGL